MFYLFSRFQTFFFILAISIVSIVCIEKISKGGNLSIIDKIETINNSNNFKFLWFEAEDAIDHSFYDSRQGIKPELFVSPEVKEKIKNIASNGYWFQISTNGDPWYKDGHYIKYEVSIPEEGKYSLYVREQIVSETSPVKWRFDEGQWNIIKDYTILLNPQKSQYKMGIKWLNYGDIFLSKGKHIFQLVIEKNYNSTYFKQIDAFVLARDKFIPNGIIKPKGTVDMVKLILQQSVSITLTPKEVINNRFHDFNRGVSFLMEWFLFCEDTHPKLYEKEILKLMEDIGLHLTRYSPYMHRIFPYPDFSSSPQWNKIKNWFLERGVEVKNNNDILNYGKSHVGKKRDNLVKDFYRFIEEENITFNKLVPDSTYLSKIDKYYIPGHTNKKIIQMLGDVPLWLSTNPLSKEYPDLYLPRDYEIYSKIWEMLVDYFTTKHPNAIQYWEVLNEPEGGGLRIKGIPYWWSSKLQDREKLLKTYLEIYDTAVRGALKANPKIKIGGPASLEGPGNDPWERRTFIEALIKHCAEHKIKLDFISWHVYYSDPITYKNKIHVVKSLLDKYGLENVELIIDEWAIGFPQIADKSSNYKKSILHITDTNINAAFAANCLQTMMDSRLTHSNFHSLIHSPGYASGLLIENLNKFPVYTKKPIYYTFKMFNMLDNKRIAVDIDNALKLGAIATKSDDEKQINLLIWNYDITERAINRKIEIKILGTNKIKYDRYLIDSKHTLFGAEELEKVESETISDSIVKLELDTNSVTLLRINLNNQGKK